MDIKASNVESQTIQNKQNNVSSKTSQNESVKFSEELKGLENKAETDDKQKDKVTDTKNDTTTERTSSSKDKDEIAKDGESNTNNNGDNSNKDVDQAFTNLSNVFNELNNHNLSQREELNSNKLKVIDKSDDNKTEDYNLINNDFNIADKDKALPQMAPNMSFSGDGQPFSSFMGEGQNNASQNNILGNSQKEIEEEAKILSTMEENIEIANKNSNKGLNSEIPAEDINDTENQQLQKTGRETEKTVNRNDGIKKVDVQSGVTIETVVKYDNIIMNEADVEVFTNLVQNNEVNLNNLTSQAASKSVQVSKTLADMLAKAQETNQPLRIDFDNDISVIIKISRDGKLSADFLPSSQVAETYLKENLPLLKQRFDENNIEYDELNQRDSRERNRDNNKRKDRNDE